MDTLTPPFAIGGAVFLVTASAYAQEYVPCPMCAGNRSVEVILGSGEHVKCECSFCRNGYQGPRGVVGRYKPTSSVSEVVVTGLEQSGSDWIVHCGTNTCRMSDARIFTDRESAVARQLEMHRNCEEQAQRNFESQFKNARGELSWTVGYHRGQIKELERKLKWHRDRLLIQSKP